jgi:hypothetical protein
MEQIGVLYVALGAPYLAMALISIASLRVFNPTIPVCIVTNVSKNPPRLALWNTELESKWIFVDETTLRNRHVKLDMYSLSPFSKTLYLDCDTLVLSDISQMSFFLDHFEMALVPFEIKPELDAKKILFDNTVQLRDIPYFNSGVIGFRQGIKVKSFFDCWKSRYEFHGFKRDQPSLIEALYTSDVRLVPLARKWNWGDGTYIGAIARREIVIWHYKVRCIDRHLEFYIRKVLPSFTDDPKNVDLVDSYIKQNRKTRRYGRHPFWLMRGIINTLRGPLSRRPERHVGSKNWTGLFVSDAGDFRRLLRPRSRWSAWIRWTAQTLGTLHSLFPEFRWTRRTSGNSRYGPVT